MGQIFHSSTNTLARASLVGLVLLLVALALFGGQLLRSNYVTQAFVPLVQPVQFSHKHHVGDNGLDCRYCHTSVERSGFAGIPPTSTCMHCHTIIWADSAALAPVRESYRTGQSLPWVRVHDLPDYTYFDHSVHIAAGVGCSTCHGRVDEMPLMWRTESLYMKWCLDCHRAPEQFLRPMNEIYTQYWVPPEDQLERGRQFIRERNIDVHRLSDCYICHR